MIIHTIITTNLRKLVTLSPLLSLLMVAGCGGITHTNVQGFDKSYPNPQNTFLFQWTRLVKTIGVEKQVLEVVEISNGSVVFRDDVHFRGRDVNVASWSATPNVLLAYSGDVGTFTFGQLDNGRWGSVAAEAWLGPTELRNLDPTVAARLPKCDGP